MGHSRTCTPVDEDDLVEGQEGRKERSPLEGELA